MNEERDPFISIETHLNNQLDIAAGYIKELQAEKAELKQQLKEARKEAFNAGRRDKKGCVVQIDYKDGGFEFPRLEDFLATKEDAQQTSDKEPTK